MGEYSSAREYEEEGEYRKAAGVYAMLGFESLLDADFDVDTSTALVGMGHLLQAVSCDARADNDRRAEWLHRILEEIVLAARDATDDPCLEGILEEWLGDGLLMVGSTDAVEHYETARERFAAVDFDSRMRWGMEEAFDYGFWAFARFAEARDYDVSRGFVRGDRFDDRVAFKLDVADAIPGEERANRSDHQ